MYKMLDASQAKFLAEENKKKVDLEAEQYLIKLMEREIDTACTNGKFYLCFDVEDFTNLYNSDVCIFVRDYFLVEGYKINYRYRGDEKLSIQVIWE